MTLLLRIFLTIIAWTRSGHLVKRYRRRNRRR